MKKWLVRMLIVLVMLVSLGCSEQQTPFDLIQAMLDTIYGVEAYQLEAELEMDGETYQIRQWFLSPDKLRTVMYQPNTLEQIVVSSGGNVEIYYSATKQWMTLSEPESGPFPWGLPLLFLLAEMVKDNNAITDTFSSIKLAAKARQGWDNCEVVISKRTSLPESCTLVKGTNSVLLRFVSLVLDPKLSDNLFTSGR